MRRISILNFKGGVGKTTLAVNLAHALSLQGKSVLLVDCERQRNASSLLPEIKDPTLMHVLLGEAPFTDAIQQARENFYIIPSHRNLNKAANHIVVVGMSGYTLLRKATKNLEGFDFLFFDHAPNPNAIGEAALLASEEMIIPCPLEPYAVEGMVDLFSSLGETLSGLEHEVNLIGIVPFAIDQRYARTQIYHKALKDRFKERVIQAVRTDENIKRAQHFHQTIFEYDPKSNAAIDIMAIATHLTQGGVKV
jgi:chromosome partitioning protein